ncbi:hypothetical protein GZH47_32585 (plasmid) [Paenibacillus rhizovicinus]|uniref:DUF3829 domain-containing protein n=1 Tax=Paenibacillus rhizovicinus TaxID=2704463 RepID=A0A6C0PAS3_9BACL|nr:hypothetical protein [Paenibacillus rhizovicinus]QHW35637.1 hypothetical protein GZH47_32585 [Paenibacillus rhizovicinus]
MKRRILSSFILLAMIFTIIVPGVSFADVDPTKTTVAQLTKAEIDELYSMIKTPNLNFGDKKINALAETNFSSATAFGDYVRTTKDGSNTRANLNKLGKQWLAKWNKDRPVLIKKYNTDINNIIYHIDRMYRVGFSVLSKETKQVSAKEWTTLDAVLSEAQFGHRKTIVKQHWKELHALIVADQPAAPIKEDDKTTLPDAELDYFLTGYVQQSNDLTDMIEKLRDNPTGLQEAIRVAKSWREIWDREKAGLLKYDQNEIDAESYVYLVDNFYDKAYMILYATSFDKIPESDWTSFREAHFALQDYKNRVSLNAGKDANSGGSKQETPQV